MHTNQSDNLPKQNLGGYLSFMRTESKSNRLTQQKKSN